MPCPRGKSVWPGAGDRRDAPVESIMNINLFVVRWDIVEKIFGVKTPWAVIHDSWYKVAKRGTGVRIGAGREPAASQ